jgi:hypothetical protein
MLRYGPPALKSFVMLYNEDLNGRDKDLTRYFEKVLYKFHRR